MESLHVEVLLGCDTGPSKSFYRSPATELLAGYESGSGSHGSEGGEVRRGEARGDPEAPAAPGGEE